MASKPSTRPTIKDRAFKCCPNCGRLPERKSTRGPAPLYCTDRPCKAEAENRATARGKAMARWALAWRKDRGSGEIAQGAFAQLCNVLDTFNSEDVAAGRPSPDVWAASTLIAQTNFFDRQKR